MIGESLTFQGEITKINRLIVHIGGEKRIIDGRMLEDPDLALLIEMAISSTVTIEIQVPKQEEIVSALGRLCWGREEANPEVSSVDPLGDLHFQMLMCRVDDLDLSVRVASTLQCRGIEYMWQLVEQTETDLLKLKNFGKVALNEVKHVLTARRLYLGMNFSTQLSSEQLTSLETFKASIR